MSKTECKTHVTFAKCARLNCKICKSYFMPKTNI